ncbi:MAG: guanylate kinase [Oscillospiraceae bacterium]|nr:guanylate kinase [Oscillospiraceae bacterium]
MQNNGMLVLFSGPSGVGKDTVLDIILDKDDMLQRSISLTTREKRQGETDGVDYYFITKDQFLNMVEDGQVLEYAQYGENIYGTPKEPVDKWLKEGKTVILKIEVKGAQKIRELYPDAVSIFLLPPSMQVLESRIRRRGTENEQDIAKRLEIAKNEILRSADYDFVVVNDDIDEASNNVLSIIKALNFTYKRMNHKISEVIKNV